MLLIILRVNSMIKVCFRISTVNILCLFILEIYFMFKIICDNSLFCKATLSMPKGHPS